MLKDIQYYKDNWRQVAFIDVDGVIQFTSSENGKVYIPNYSNTNLDIVVIYNSESFEMYTIINPRNVVVKHE
jgi:hypothetical protein